MEYAVRTFVNADAVQARMEAATKFSMKAGLEVADAFWHLACWLRACVLSMMAVVALYDNLSRKWVFCFPLGYRLVLVFVYNEKYLHGLDWENVSAEDAGLRPGCNVSYPVHRDCFPIEGYGHFADCEHGGHI